MNDLSGTLHSLPLMFDALVQTLLLSVTSAAIALLVGVVLASLCRLKLRILSWLILRYDDIVRGCPPLVFIFLIFFLLPVLGINTSKFVAALVSISVYFSGFVCETLRGASKSIPSGQVYAAQALGMSRFQSEYIVIFPQAIRISLPSMLNLSAILVKTTSLASLIGFWELTLATRELVVRTVQPFTYFGIAFVFYFIVCFSLAYISKRVAGRH